MSCFYPKGLTSERRSWKVSQIANPKSEQERIALLQGTLDLLILRTLVFGPNHGQGIARTIQQQAEDALLVDHGSLYPALQRLESRGWITGGWSVSENNRKARFYTLTKLGRKQLVSEARQWWRLVTAVGRILGPGWSVKGAPSTKHGPLRFAPSGTWRTPRSGSTNLNASCG